MMIHPNKRNKRQVVFIGFVSAIKYDDITECSIIHLSLEVAPKHYRHMPSPISLVVEIEIWISMFLSYQVIHDYLGITNGEHLQLIAMAEIVKVPCCKSNLIITTMPLSILSIV
jgi:hypothetical protein